MKEIIVASYFDGIACAKQVFDVLGVPIKSYYAWEICPYAIKIAMKNHPIIIQRGSVINAKLDDLPKIDFFVGGSPCTGFSRAGRMLNFEDKQSKLFFEYVHALKYFQSKNPNLIFLLENVNMKQEWQDIISDLLGVKPIRINSKLLSGSLRDRLYWTNIKGVEQPEDKGIELCSILQSGEVDRDKSYCLDANYFKGTNAKQYLCKSRRQIVWTIPEATKKGYVEVSEGQCIDLTFIKSKTRRGRLMLKKSNCLTATPGVLCKVTNDWFRMFTPIEMERLQTLPDNYTQGVSISQRKKMIGNAWTIDVIAHILKGAFT